CADKAEQDLQSGSNDLKLMHLLHGVKDENSAGIFRIEGMRRSHCAADHALYFLIVAGFVVEPDTIDVARIFDFAHGTEWDVEVAIGIVLVAFLHLGFENSDHGKADTVTTNRLADGRHPRKELRLCLGTYHHNPRFLIHIIFVEEASLIDSKRANPID